MGYKEDIFSVNAKRVIEKRERVDIPELGKPVFVHLIPIAYKAKLATVEQSDIIPWVIIYSTHDEAGKRIFADNDFAEVAKLTDFIIDPLFAAAANLNKLSATDKELEGNSEANQSDSSSSG